MATDTRVEFNDLVIYEVFARAYSNAVGQQLKSVAEDLPRLKALGVTTVWLMPIHPTGEKDRKGKLGSPYAIKDYYAIDPMIGDERQMKELVERAHELKMGVIMDMVLNHCATDAEIVSKHPDWFMKDENGNSSRKVDDWEDVYDFDYTNPEVADYMVKMMEYWVREFDIDGFRCDVAGLVPLPFWLRARRELAEVKKGLLWLSETHDPHMYEAFDVTYDYDGYYRFRDVLDGKASLHEYLDYIASQDGFYPPNYIKMRFLENHDQVRVASLIEDELILKNWATWLFTCKGIPLVYNGQEYGLEEKPDIFNEYFIPWKDGKESVYTFYRRLGHLRSSSWVIRRGAFTLLKNSRPEGVISFLRHRERRWILAVLNVDGKEEPVEIDFGGLTDDMCFHAWEMLSDEYYRLKITKGKTVMEPSREPLILSGYAGC